MRISDWSSDVCSSDLPEVRARIPIDQEPAGPLVHPAEAIARAGAALLPAIGTDPLEGQSGLERLAERTADEGFEIEAIEASIAHVAAGAERVGRPVGDIVDRAACGILAV